MTPVLARETREVLAALTQHSGKKDLAMLTLTEISTVGSTKRQKPILLPTCETQIHYRGRLGLYFKPESLILVEPVVSKVIPIPLVHHSLVLSTSQGITKCMVPLSLPVEAEKSYSGELEAETVVPLPVLRYDIN